MTLSQVLIGIIYYISQGIAGITGFAVFVLVLIGKGFDSKKTTGNRTEIFIGSGFILSILLALLSVGPLFGFDKEYTLPEYPTELFRQSYWIIYLLILIGNTVGLIWRIRRKSLAYLLIPAMGLVAASWVAKTIGVMIFVFQTEEINLLLKIIFELYCAVMGVLYLAVPAITAGVLAGKGTRYQGNSG